MLKKMYDQILDAIRRGNITNGDISKATGIPLEKCGKLLRQMRDEGILISLNRGKWTIRPIIPPKVGRKRKYDFGSLAVGESMELPAVAVKSVYTIARRAKIKVSWRSMKDGTYRVWRIA